MSTESVVDELRVPPTRILREDSAPLHLRCGEDFLTCKLPANTRVIYPNKPQRPVTHRGASIRQALRSPLGTAPLAELIKPGYRVTITVEGIGALCPPMAAPDVRASALEVLTALLEERGVEDYAILIDRALDRRATRDELAHIVGDRLALRLFPRRLYHLDIEEREQAVEIGETSAGEPVLVHRRIADSDLLIHVGITQPPAYGAQARIGAGFMGKTAEALYHNAMGGEDHGLAQRVGAVLAGRVDLFHIALTLNNDHLDPQLAFLARPEETWRGSEQLKLSALRATARLPMSARRALMHAPRAAFGLLGVHAGDARQVHAAARALALGQHTVSVEEQADIVIHDLGPISPFNQGAAMNPLIARAVVLGQLHSLHTGTPLLKRGGSLILVHPLRDEFDPTQHAAHAELFQRCLPHTSDGAELEQRWRAELTHNPNYVELYRRGHGYHSSQPFALWRWSERGAQHAGQLLVVGAQSAHVPQRLGFTPARSMDEAILLAQAKQGRSARISLVRHGANTVIDVRQTP
jgi:hypothetical protein